MRRDKAEIKRKKEMESYPSCKSCGRKFIPEAFTFWHKVGFCKEQCYHVWVYEHILELDKK